MVSIDCRVGRVTGILRTGSQGRVGRVLFTLNIHSITGECISASERGRVEVGISGLYTVEKLHTFSTHPHQPTKRQSGMDVAPRSEVAEVAAPEVATPEVRWRLLRPRRSLPLRSAKP